MVEESPDVLHAFYYVSRVSQSRGTPTEDGPTPGQPAPSQILPRHPRGHGRSKLCPSSLSLARAREDRRGLALCILLLWLQGAPHKKPPGRPPKLPPTQKESLATLLEEGPVTAGCSGACWRSPMIQQLLHDRFGVFYNVFYIAQWLKSLGFSDQNAAFVSDHLHADKRHG
jgi:winged helix-turn-helix protein